MKSTEAVTYRKDATRRVVWRAQDRSQYLPKSAVCSAAGAKLLHVKMTDQKIPAQRAVANVECIAMAEANAVQMRVIMWCERIAERTYLESRQWLAG